MNINILGIDVAKNVFQLHGINKAGETVLKKRLTRNKLLEYVKTLKVNVVVMEACGNENLFSVSQLIS